MHSNTTTGVLEKVEFFRGKHSRFITAVCQLLRPEFYAPVSAPKLAACAWHKPSCAVVTAASSQPPHALFCFVFAGVGPPPLAFTLTSAHLPITLLQGDVVIFQGDVAMEMYFVIQVGPPGHHFQ